MILRHLELKHFGRFAERSFEFRRGLNLVTGPNEAGKSTLMEAVPAILFGMRNKERFKPWGRQGSCEAALVLEGRNRTVRVERDLLTDRVTLIERDDLYQILYRFEGKVAPLGRSSERSEYLEQLQRLFGMTEEEIFRASLFFGQGSLEVTGEGGMAAKMKSLLSGFVEVDYDRVLDSLVEDYFAVTRHSPWGKDKTRDRELDEIRKRIEALEGRWYQAREGVQEAQRLQAEIESLNASIEADRVEFEKGERYLAWVRRQWQLEEKEGSLRRDFDRVHRQKEKVAELEARRAAAEQEWAKTGLPRQIPEDLPRILAEAETVRKELMELQVEAAKLREQLLAQEGPSCWPPVGATCGFFLLGGLLGWFGGWLVPALLGAGLLSAVAWSLTIWKAGLKSAERGRLKGQAQVQERRREGAQARLAALDERFEKIGMSPSAIEIVKMQKSLEKNRALQEELREVESALRVLEKEDSLAVEKEQLTRQLAVIDERLEKERPLRGGAELLSPEDLAAAEEKLQELGASLKARERQLLELSRKEAALQGELGDLQQIEEEGEQLKEREVLLSRRKEALNVGHDLLAASVEEFRKSYLERFAGDIGQHLGAATRGRYEAVRLSEEFDLSLPGKAGGWQPAEHFSRGTRDTLYFAMRLALTRHLSRGKPLPLLLDDPLVNLDRHRLGETLKLLERIAAEHQVILFAHDEALLRRAARDRWHVLSLEETKVAPQPSTQERSEDVGQLYLL